MVHGGSSIRHTVHLGSSGFFFFFSVDSIDGGAAFHAARERGVFMHSALLRAHPRGPAREERHARSRSQGGFSRSQCTSRRLARRRAASLLDDAAPGNVRECSSSRRQMQTRGGSSGREDCSYGRVLGGGGEKNSGAKLHGSWEEGRWGRGGGVFGCALAAARRTRGGFVCD